jgi:RHS repeat-associated protein
MLEYKIFLGRFYWARRSRSSASSVKRQASNVQCRIPTAFGATTDNRLPTTGYRFYTGKPQVAGLGHVFLFRNYRSDLGKWQTSDPMGYPDGFNNFAYCNNGILQSLDSEGAKTLKDSTSIVIKPQDYLPLSSSAVITHAMIVYGIFGDLKPTVNVVATGNDSGQPPTITGENFFLTGTTSGGGGFAVGSIGYSVTYDVVILAHTLASSTLTTNEDGSQTLTNVYNVYLGFHFVYDVLTHIENTTMISQPVTLTLSNTIPE